MNPDDPSAHHWYAINYLVPLRRFEEAATELGLAAAADPLSMAIRASVGIRRYFAHDFGYADRELRHCLELDPGSPTARLFLGLTLAEMSRAEDAIRELETATQGRGQPGDDRGAGLRVRSGWPPGARRWIAGRTPGAGGPALRVTFTDCAGSMPDLAVGRALEWLERASDVRAVDLAWLAVRPVFDALRPDPRFNALVARIFH